MAVIGGHPPRLTISMPKPRFESAKLLSDLRQSIFQELALVMTL
jgi:NitT/TauT family transport system ATP-binding protein